ncbi:hypothetical protein ABH926_002187 [Catenulispora sp. GP43]|uniref:DUF742 domain-containing protein n=1 Tax=Catenulispora sp. GP43 TaxID=3156263 RepID=UPI003517C3B0
MSTGSPPPRTSWLGSGPSQQSTPPRPRHAADHHAGPDHASPDRASPDHASPDRAGAEKAPPAAAMPRRGETTNPESPPSPRRSTLERIYVITGGRSAPAADLDLVTLIVAADAAPPGLSPEQATIMRLCRRPLSVAEVSAYVRLPFSATAILVADLLATGLLVQRRPIRAAGVDPELLKKVINGLRRL